MKSFLIFLSFIATTYAGVGVVTPEIEAKALRLWQAHCEGTSEEGSEGQSRVFCKKARGAVRMNLRHQVAIGSGSAQREQVVVFIQPPSYSYNTTIFVSGGSVASRKTIVYVKPSKNSHTYQVKDETTPGKAGPKPQLFFLGKSHGGESTTDKSPVTPPPPTYLPPSTPPPTYLPPSTPPPTYLPPSTPPPTYLPPSKPGYNYDPPSSQLQY